MSEEKRYHPVLNQFPAYAESADAILPDTATAHERLTALVTAPVLFTYVWYVLQEAERMGLKRLYFLARDGCVMLSIAKEIARVCPVGLELRYLYCSRASLRMPTYHRIPPEEAMDLLLHRGTCLTLRHILDRADCTDAQRQEIYKDCEMTAPDENKALSENEFSDFCGKLRRSTVFRRIVMYNSKAAYASALPYFQQEGLTDGTKFGVVDSGWTGSMQRSLRQFSDEIPPMTGFYFGMFSKPKSSLDGVYKTWYFSAESSIALRTKFSNNVFECMCAAPHGMTTGYRLNKENRCVPVMKPSAADSAMTERITRQIDICSCFAKEAASRIDYTAFQFAQMHKLCRILLQKLMYTPTREEAEAFGDFPFCDDVTESYTDTLVRKDAVPVLREHMLVTRIFRKMKGYKPSAELFWSYGTLAVSGMRMQALRRVSLRGWDVGRYLADKFKELRQ